MLKRFSKKHWSDVPIYDDVTKLSKEVLDNDRISVDLICGGFPCQDISVAGVKKGIEGERSGLWSEFARLISEIRPKYAIVENVPNLLSGDRGRWFGRVLGDLAKIGYDAEWHCISASELGARHHRDRVWIIATPQRSMANTKRVFSDGINNNSRKFLEGKSSPKFRNSSRKKNVGNPTSNGWDENQSETKRSKSTVKESERGRMLQSEGTSNVSNSERIGQSRSRVHGRRISKEKNKDREASWLIHHCKGDSSIWHTEPQVGRVADGIPNRSHRLRCLGNAVVPQIPELIGKAIMDAES